MGEICGRDDGGSRLKRLFEKVFGARVAQRRGRLLLAAADEPRVRDALQRVTQQRVI
ncbi:MAG: hypothetical protein M3Q82_10340 [Actinomycetota bacterium]|nr:hypothetical protein [Actinomycetota bacterium]